MSTTIMVEDQGSKETIIFKQAEDTLREASRTLKETIYQDAIYLTRKPQTIATEAIKQAVNSKYQSTDSTQKVTHTAIQILVDHLGMVPEEYNRSTPVEQIPYDLLDASTR